VATATGTAAYAKARGMQVVYQDRYPTGATDVSALLSKIKDLSPDVVAGGSYVPDSELITRQARTLDVTPRALAFSVGAAEPDFGAALGPDADYVLGPSMWEPTLQTPGNPAFVESYQQRWHRLPDARAAAGFAAGQVLEAAVQQAGSLQGETLRNALAALETPTILPGTFKADPSGASAGHLPVLVQWQGKQRPVVWPESLQTAPPRLPMPAWTSR
jgi:branched-chain amino acid transport system substrate-binding protein